MPYKESLELAIKRVVRNRPAIESKGSKRRGFLLGVVLLVSLLMAVFIFSFNSIVRQRNIQAHHLMISETTGYLAISGLHLLAERLHNSFETTLKSACPELFTKTAAELGNTLHISSNSALCANARNDFQNFLNTLEDLREPGLIGGYPVCLGMEIKLEKVQSLNPDTTAEQFQIGRDPVEKCGQLTVKCSVEYRGLRREASMTRQFRVISMIPGPFSRFSLFVKRTPYPDSYNALGVKFDGTIDNTYRHPPVGGKTFTGPLVVFNGTDSIAVTPSMPERNLIEDKEHLRSRGWVFLGPSAPGGDEAVFVKIPSGFDPSGGGHFMLGWPSVSALPVLAPEVVDDSSSFAPHTEFVGHEYSLGGRYQGFYTWEEGNQYGAGGKNLWPGLSAGAAFEPADRIRSASTWLYPYGNQNRESRTLMVGPVLAGFLKFCFIRGRNTSTAEEYRGLWANMPESMFNIRAATNKTLDSFGLWSGNLSPPVYALDFFKNGFESFKKLMPYNSLPSPSPIMPGNGIAFNLIFDFMKYQRDFYPNLMAAPSIAGEAFDSERFLVPQAEEMRNCPVKGLHPHNKMGIFLNEDGRYNPNSHPDNCYFMGDPGKLTILDSNLLSGRITHTLDLRECGTTEEEQEATERFLFKAAGNNSAAINETCKTGIFLIVRRNGVSSSFSDALILSKKPVKLVKPLIVIIDKGSMVLQQDITSAIADGAPATLCTLALVNGHFFIDGNGSSRIIHAYMASLSPSAGRMLRPPASAAAPRHFQISGGLALTEIGLYENPNSDPLNHLGTTMSNFTQGGEIQYNPRFNPSSPAMAESRVFVIEDASGKISIEGAGT